MTRLRITTADAIMAGTTLCAVTRVNADIISLQPLEADANALNLTHQELSDFLDDGSFTIEHDYFGDSTAAQRAVAGRKLLSMLPEREQARVFWKIHWCEAFLKHHEPAIKPIRSGGIPRDFQD